MEFIKQTSPHVKRKDNLTWMLLDVIIALAPVCIFAWVVYPLDALRIFPLSIATMLACELIFVLITKKSIKEFKMQNLLSAMVSALIYSLAMPTNPGWGSGIGYVVVIFGAAIGMILGKLVFGGTGNNIFNPAALGMIVARLGWGGKMSGSTSPIPGFMSNPDVLAGGTPMSIGSSYSNLSQLNLLDLLIGRVPGSLGEGFKIAILVGLVYLLIRHTIDWRTFVSYAGTFVFLMAIASIFVFTRANVNPGLFLGYQILSGGFLFGAVYMITDPVTGPMTSPSRVLFGAFGAAIAVFIRLFTASPEGVGYSILFANLIAPVLDYPKWTSAKWKKWHFISLGSFLALAVLVVALVMQFKEGAVA